MADILEIEDGVLKECTDKDVESVVIPPSVTEIGTSAFKNCTSLSSVVIPESVTEIGGDAFKGCESLASVVIPEGVSKIGGDAFRGCESLSSVEIPSSVTEIGGDAFKGCNINELSHPCLTIKGGLVVEESKLLYCASQSSSITIPEGVTAIGGTFAGAFDGCESLASVVIPNSVTKIGRGAFEDCKSLASVEIPSSVTEIGDWAFLGCSSLTSVEIPSSVTKIGERAFRGCESLASVEIPSSVTEIGEMAFKGCSSLASVVIPNSVKQIGYKAFYGCESLASVEIPPSVTIIGIEAFDGCSSLSSVSIPSSVAEIGKQAFYGCESLTSVEFSGTVAQWKSVEKMSGWHYGVPATTVKCSDGEACTDMDAKSEVIPEGVTTIGRRAFSGCKLLTSVVIPSSVTAICENAFAGCKSLSSVEFGGTVAQWDAVKGKLELPEHITSVKCADGEWQKPVLFVEDGVFEICFDKDATSVVIPEGVTTIGYGAFRNCTSLTSVEFGGTAAQWESVKGKLELPEHITSVKCADGEWQKPVLFVEDGVAVKCFDKSAASVVIPEGVTEIGNGAFSGCESLASVEIPPSVTGIGRLAFRGCTSLESVEIPSSVTEIGWSAFGGCKSLTSVEFSGTVAQWKSVKKARDWHGGVPAKSLKCADGESEL